MPADKLNPAGLDLLDAIGQAIGTAKVRPSTPEYITDPRGLRQGQAAAVLFPDTVEDVSAILKLANAARVGVVPFSGGTGLVGGQIKPEGSLPLVLSLQKMNKVRDIDMRGNVMVAEAGVILDDVRAAADRSDRLFPLSLASGGSCRIGGNLATNAGGVQVLRYGNARDLCLGIEAVLADGTIIHNLKRLRKDNTGYDLRNLLIGSEGTLGVITAASLKLFPKPSVTATALVGVASPSAALDFLNHMRDRLGDAVAAFELIHGQGLEFLREKMPQVSLPLSTDWLVLVEVSGGNVIVADSFETALVEAFENKMISETLIAANESQRRVFWTLRESIPLANRRIGYVSAHDVSLPLNNIPPFLSETTAAIAALDSTLRVNAFGHLGDGNLHFNVFPGKGRKADDYDDLRRRLVRLIHDRIDKMGGSFSAEHGIGRAKVAELLRYGDPGRLTAMRAIKHALDPNGILNPGAVIEV